MWHFEVLVVPQQVLEPKTLQSVVDDKNSLLFLYQFYIDKISSLEGVKYTHSTIKLYTSSFTSLRRFLSQKDISVSDIDNVFAEDFYYYLITVEKLQSNSAFKKIKALYRVLNYAVERRLIPSNPCKAFRCKYKQPDRPFLNNEEIERIYSLTIKDNYLMKLKDIFVFQIYSGLAYIDVKNLRPSNIQTGVDGKQWIITHRQKTDTRVAIPILPRAKEILLKYRYQLPVLSNQKYNKYLKYIALLCKIDKNLTTHVARHTFATTILLSNNIPIETVSKVLGHNSISTTQIYAKIVDTKISKDFAALL